MNIGQEFQRMLENTAARLGRELQANMDEVRLYASERMLHLSTIVDEPGYDEALLAERDNVALRAGLNAVSAGDAADREIIGVIAGSLAIGARALAAA